MSIQGLFFQADNEESKAVKYAKLRELYLNELYSLIGEQNIETYLRLHKRRLKRMKALRVVALDTPNRFTNITNQRHKNIIEAQKLAKKYEININALKEIRQKHAVMRDQLFSSKISASQMASRVANVQKLIARLDNKTKMSIYPPYQQDAHYTWQYPHWISENSWVSNCFSYSNRYIGELRGESTIGCGDPSNKDFCMAQTSSWIGSDIIVPRTGKMIIKANLKNLVSNFQLHLWQQCGYADIVSEREMYIVITTYLDENNREDIVSPIFIKNMPCRLVRKTKDDMSAIPGVMFYDHFYSDYFDWASNGEMAFALVQTSKSYQQGDRVFIGIELKTRNWFETDDIEVTPSEITQDWIVSSVDINI